MSAPVRLKKNVRLECPYCHAGFFVQSGQKEGLCYNCGRLLNTLQLERDVRAQELGFSDGYQSIMQRAQRFMADKDYLNAETTFAKAVKAAPDDCEARYGLLCARTNQFSRFPEILPQDLYSAALECANQEQTARIGRSWQKYVEAHHKYWKTKREEEELRKKEKRRQEEQRRRQNSSASGSGQQFRGTQRGTQSAGNGRPASGNSDSDTSVGRRIGRFVLISLGVIVCVLGIAACAATGGGAGLFFLIGAGLLGGNGRNRNDRKK